MMFSKLSGTQITDAHTCEDAMGRAGVTLDPIATAVGHSPVRFSVNF